MIRTTSFSYKEAITKSSTALFNHQFSETDFFNNELVNYLSNYLPFDFIAAVTYNEKLEYVSVADRAGIYFSDHSYASFWQNDKCGRYISQCLMNKKMAPLPETPMMFQSTNIISTEDYAHSNYVSYINNQLSVHYSISLPFGLNGRFRIVLYKKRDHGDFSDCELDLLSNIYTLVLNSYRAFENIQSRKEASILKSELLSECNMGTLILDEYFQVLDYNHLATVILPMLTNHMDIHDASSYLLHSILNIRNIRQAQQPLSFYRNGYAITVIPRIDFGRTGAHKKYYMIYFKSCSGPLPTNACVLESSMDFLTKREMQIVKCLVEGMTYQEISESLFISLSTVRKHSQNIFEKLGIHNQRKLISLYMRSQEKGI